MIMESRLIFDMLNKLGPLSAVMYLGMHQESIDGLTPKNSDLLRKTSLAVCARGLAIIA